MSKKPILKDGPHQTELSNYVELLWDNGKLEKQEKYYLTSDIQYALLEVRRNSFTVAAKLVCPLCRSGHKVYFDDAMNYFHEAGEFNELRNPCKANAIWQERNRGS